MDRLQSELLRLFGEARERALVLQIVAPAGWAQAAQVWRGVQADLDLPAPAIAVDGDAAYQLWFPFTQAPAATDAAAFVEGLRARYLSGVAPDRIRTTTPHTTPPAQVAPERWSAFLAPDLAPLFEDDRCIDQPPGADAQADLLSRVQVTRPGDFARASARLAPAEDAAAAAPSSAPRAPGSDPRQFLLSVMQDPAVDLRLRIEAARALLAERNAGEPR